MSVTSHDVAKAAGVSQPTVSRALRDDPNIAEATKAHVAAVAKKLGYVTNELGRSLSLQATKRVAVVADLDNPLWPMLIEQLHDGLAQSGYSMTLLAEHGDLQRFELQLLGGWADAVILTSARVGSALPVELRRRGVPFVLVNRTIKGLRADAAVADNVGGGRAAAHVLAEAGHTRVAALFGPQDTSTGRDREKGFRAGLDEAGLTLPVSRVVHGEFDYAFGRQALPLLLKGRHRATAIFCANDIIAIGALNTARQLGLSVPSDIAFVGFDDLEQASWPAFDLTTIRIPFETLVRAAVTRVLARLAGDTSPPRVEVHPVVPVLRGTHLR